MAQARTFIAAPSLYCFPQALHSIKYPTIEELQLKFSFI